MLLQPLVAVVYIGSAAVAVSICDYLPLRRRNILVSGCVAAASMAYCLKTISVAVTSSRGAALSCYDHLSLRRARSACWLVASCGVLFSTTNSVA